MELPQGSGAVTEGQGVATRYLTGEADAVRKFTRLHEVAFAGNKPAFSNALAHFEHSDK